MKKIIIISAVIFGVIFYGSKKAENWMNDIVDKKKMEISEIEINY